MKQHDLSVGWLQDQLCRMSARVSRASATPLVGALMVVSSLFGLPLAMSADGQSLLLRDVTIVDVTDGSLRSEQSVRIEGGRIAEIALAGDLDVPAGATVVEASGKFLIPGLWDMHTHTFNNNAPQPPNTWTFPLFLANGVTGVRDMWVKPGEQSDLVRSWRREMANGTFLGPRFGAIGTLVDGTPPVQPGADTLRTAAEARAYVKRLHDANIDFVKIYSRLTPEVYSAIAEAATAAGMYIAGHGPVAMSSFEVADAGQRSIEHLTGLHATCSTDEDSLRAQDVGVYTSPDRFISTFDEAKCARLYERLRSSETWQVPTLVTNRIWAQDATLEGLMQDEGILFVPMDEIAEWEWVSGFLEFTSPERRANFADLHELERRIVHAMNDAGVPLLAGTDFGNPYIYPGFSLHDELSEFVDAGLSPLEALQTATLNPARYLQRTDDLGTVDEGKLADLVLLDANPLVDITHARRISAVVLNGRLIQRDELDRMKNAVLADNYRKALAQPPGLVVQQPDVSELQRFVGTFLRHGKDGQAVVSVEGDVLRVDFGDWADVLESLGGTLFRVPGTTVTYVFHLSEAEGQPVWAFEIHEDGSVYTFHRGDS